MTRKSPILDRKPRDLRSNAPVALVDMDETLCDYSGAIQKGLAALRGPGEDPGDEQSPDPPPYIAARRRLIMSVPGFWRSLRPLPFGFQIVEALAELGFDTHIVTKGPSDQPLAWMEKVEWCRQHVPQTPVVIAEDKGLVRGEVLVEDWPPYIARWLERRPRGFVIVPAHPWNADVEATFPGKAMRYDGTNLDTVRRRLRAILAAAGKNRNRRP